ncbi:hypothetical protein [Pseudoroseicyclus aestuarii]|uniref:Uncharacterized protein n=1 Tax=Pseudoroseicyclus aestuarii TaxID=1795041 RepID=A0A318T2C1_9RHOB|nr:hypothetical protein [Pseudoroseicyclus aestuarii]PYE84364.1 hypothetical protein DFP88_102162 [Pseudoroseicyclus aestuarii]
MTIGPLLELVWQGALRPSSGAAEQRAQRMLEAVLPVRTISLTASRGMTAAYVQPENIELMPALSLGDVLAEELDLEVPYGALVAIAPANLAASPDDEALSRRTGMVLGEALLGAMERGAFPLAHEGESLDILACAYGALAGGPEAQRSGLVAGAFRAGLAASLSRHPACDQQVAAVGTARDAATDPRATRPFLDMHELGAAPEAAQVLPDLLRCEAGLDHEAWMAMLSKTVCAALADGTAPALSRRGF